MFPRESAENHRIADETFRRGAFKVSHMRTENKTEVKRRQPVVVKPPNIRHPVTASMSSQAGSAIVALVETFSGPDDLPNIGVAAINAEECIRCAVREMPESKALLELLLEGLQQSRANASPQTKQPLGLAGRRQMHPEWDLITNEAVQSCSIMQKIIGVELVHAYISQRRFSKQLSVRLNGLLDKSLLDQKELDFLEAKYVAKLSETRKTLAQRIGGLTSLEANLNYQFNAYLQSQFSSLKVAEKQASGGSNELLEVDYLTLFSELRAKVEQGDHQAAVRCTAFCLGLSTPLTEKVPFSLDGSSSYVISICPADGTHSCDLSSPLGALAKSGPGNRVETKNQYQRPFPEFLADYWRKAAANNPTAAAVCDVGKKRRSKFATRIQDTQICSGIAITEARLVASRGQVFLNAGVQRDTAAYAALAPFLLDRSDFHYIFKTPDEIWCACATVFESIGWGNAVPRPDHMCDAVGTKKSPEHDAIRKKIKSLREGAIESRPGRRYSLESLALGHNAFVKYVAFMFMFFLGGRNRSAVAYRADAWVAGNPFGVHVDKPFSTNQSRVQSPLPQCLSISLSYVSTHYQQLDARLKKLGFTEVSGPCKRIKAILAGEPVNLLFKFDELHQDCDLKLRDVILKADELAKDTCRHYLPKALERAGVHFNCIQAWLKHHASGTSVNSVTTPTPPIVWLVSVASSLDEIALDLGLTPVHGLSKQ